MNSLKVMNLMMCSISDVELDNTNKTKRLIKDQLDIERD